MGPADTSTETTASDGGLLDWRPVRLALVWVFPALVCLMGAAAIYVSQLSVSQDIHVMTQPSWVPGEPAAVRVIAYGDRGALLDEVGVELSLEREDGATEELAAVRSSRGVPAVDLDAVAPRWDEGTHSLRARVVTPAGREEIAAEIVLAGKAPARDLHLPPPPADRPRGDTSAHDIGGVRVEILPYGHALVPNLTCPLFVRITDERGRPVATEVGLRLVAGTLREPLPESVTTDLVGLALLSVHPQSNDIGIEVSLPRSAGSVADAGDGGPPSGVDAGASDGGDAGAPAASPEVARIQVATSPAGLVLRLRSPVPEETETLDVAVESLHASRPVYVDAYREGRWIASRATVLRGGRAKVRLPVHGPGLTLVQAYTSPVDVGHGFSAHHVYVRGAEQTDSEALAAIASTLRAEGLETEYLDALMEEGLLARRGVRFERVAAFLLSRLDRGYVPPVRLVSSERVRSAELAAFQRSSKIRLSIGIGILGLLVTVLLAYSFSVAAWRARQRRLSWDAATGAKEDDIYFTSMGRPRGLDRFRTVVQIALMVGVVAVGFVLFAVLVLVMSWHGY